MSASMTIPAASDAELVRVVRESLRLADGDRVIVERRDGELVLRREEPTPTDPPPGRLIRENGLLVWDSGVDIGEGDILQWIDDDRERRMKYVSGIVAEP